ncbi:MAG: hypothetical protein IT294_01170 [Deltaproteobacteria bacterium]|nr:hypothetical protein [Deltaproteobacteria bacterium]
MRRPVHADIAVARAVSLAPVALVFPVGAIAGYGFGTDRARPADVIAWVYSCALVAACTTAFWPLPSLRAWTAERRARSTAPPELLTIETLSVPNGLVGVTGLVRWKRSRGRDLAAVLMLMATAVVHLYATAYYYLSEVVAGLPNVDTLSFTDTWIEVGLANAPWLTVPWVVLWWGWRTLAERVAGGGAPPARVSAP